MSLILDMASSELVLVCGDMHLGSRVGSLPPAFVSILLPGKMAHVLCTGNGGLAPSTAAQQAGAGAGEALDFLRSLAPRLHAVRGDCDDDGASVRAVRLDLRSAATSPTSTLHFRLPLMRSAHDGGGAAIYHPPLPIRVQSRYPRPRS